MNELTALRLYLACKLHFLDKKFDVFANNGRVANVNQTTLQSNKARRAMLNRVMRDHPNPQEMVQFFVAQYAYADNSAIYDSMQSEENYSRWIGRKPSITYQTLELLSDVGYNNLIAGDPPLIFKMIIQDSAWIESAVALNRVKPFLMKHYFAFNDLSGKIVKLGGFVKFDIQKVTQEVEDEEATVV
jgi:hypothetical protein